MKSPYRNSGSPGEFQPCSFTLGFGCWISRERELFKHFLLFVLSRVIFFEDNLLILGCEHSINGRVLSIRLCLLLLRVHKCNIHATVEVAYLCETGNDVCKLRIVETFDTSRLPSMVIIRCPFHKFIRDIGVIRVEGQITFAVSRLQGSLTVSPSRCVLSVSDNTCFAAMSHVGNHGLKLVEVLTVVIIVRVWYTE